MATMHQVFSSPEEIIETGESIARSMIAQYISGVNGTIEPKYALKIGNVIRAQNIMSEVAVSVCAKLLRRLVASVVLNVALIIALIVAIVV